MGVFILSWAVFGPRPAKGMRNILFGFLVGGVLLLGFVEYLPDFMEETPAGKRFQEFLDEGDGNVAVSVKKLNRA